MQAEWAEVIRSSKISFDSLCAASLITIFFISPSPFITTFTEPPPEAPDAPSGVVATEGDSEVLVTWNESFGATEYYVYRETQASGGTTGGGTTDGGGTDDGGTDGGQGDCDDGYLMD